MQYANLHSDLPFTLLYLEALGRQGKSRKRKSCIPSHITDPGSWKKDLEFIKEMVDIESGRRNFLIEEIENKPVIIFRRTWEKLQIILLPSEIPVRHGKDQTTEDLSTRYWIGQEALVFAPDYLQADNKAKVEIAGQWHDASIVIRQRRGILRQFPLSRLITVISCVAALAILLGAYNLYRSRAEQAEAAEKKRLQIAAQWKSWPSNYQSLKFASGWKSGLFSFKLYAACDSSDGCVNDLLLHIQNDSGKVLTTIRISHNDMFKVRLGEIKDDAPDMQLNGTFINVVEVPYWAASECRDSTFSASTGSGTCSHHSGVKRRLPYPIDLADPD